CKKFYPFPGLHPFYTRSFEAFSWQFELDYKIIFLQFEYFSPVHTNKQTLTVLNNIKSIKLATIRPIRADCGPNV
ncbi:hypothetical protein Bhyg_13069, partial [Pseudolycoriella hygida]